MAYDENGNYVPDGDAFNLRTFNTNQNSGYAGQSMSPDYMSSFGLVLVLVHLLAVTGGRHLVNCLVVLILMVLKWLM